MKKEVKQLLQKFKHIGFLDYKKVIEDLKQYNSISDKLDYLLTLKEKYYDKYEKVMQSLSHKENVLYLTGNNRGNVWNSVFGDTPTITLLPMQVPVYETYFKDASNNNAEYTYWFLKYIAKLVLESFIRQENIIEKINSKTPKKFIDAELKKIKDFEDNADKLLFENKIDIYKQYHHNFSYKKELEYHRIKAGYYEKNILNELNYGSLAIQVYARNIYLKEYLVKNNSQQTQSNKKEALSIEKEDVKNDYIISTIDDYLEPIKEYFNDKDYNLLVEELNTYFKTNIFSNSTIIINTVNKPNVKLIGWHLKELYNNYFNDNRKLSIEYLRFGKDRISVFKNVSFDESNYLKSNLYKYYTTRVSKT